MKRGLLVFGLIGFGASAMGQLARYNVAGGFVSPIQYAEDPVIAGRAYVVEQGGVVRILDNGVPSGDFLTIPTGDITTGGERGLLGLTFAPDYATSGHVYVNFTNAAGNNQIARFTRNGNTLDYSTRHNVLSVADPYENHNGGRIAFGPDGYLYLSFGDGGDGFDPEGRAQDPDELLGKFLRIDPTGDDFPGDSEQNYAIPSSNPFVGSDTHGIRDEVWSIGWRNPFKWSFDDFGPGATNAFIAGDVGQGSWEEIDYEPAGAGGRNYGWVVREGSSETGMGSALFEPLTDPIFEYGRTEGGTVIGGFVYRGGDLDPEFQGRYFFGDFLSRRIWSLHLTIDGNGEATAGGLLEHTGDFGSLGMISSIDRGVDGELYVVEYSTGNVFRIGMVPEPATWLALAGGAMALRLRRRK